MQYDIICKPSYSTLKCILKKGEAINCETGAMLAMDSSAQINGNMQGGVWKAVKRSMLTGESFFVTGIEAQKNDTEVYLAPRATGDIEALELKNEEYIVQGGGFLASVGDLETDSHFTGWKGLMSGEGVFMIKVVGTGTLFISSFGGIFSKDLKKGETFSVDNGHLVAFPAQMNYTVQKVGQGVSNMVTTGEGLCVVLEGPGKVLLQTRNLRSFAESLNPFLHTRNNARKGSLFSYTFGG